VTQDSFPSRLKVLRGTNYIGVWLEMIDQTVPNLRGSQKINRHSIWFHVPEGSLHTLSWAKIHSG
jgi:hypothetical protein